VGIHWADRTYIRNDLEVVSREKAMSKQGLNRISENRMVAGGMLVAIAAVLIGSTALANKKEKAPLPEIVVRAQSVAVLLLPGTRESIADPVGNRKAQEDVEKALMKWGRYRLTQEAFTADLVIGIRKSTGTVASPTVGGPPSDTRPGTIETTDNAIRIGAQKGRPPGDTQSGDAAGTNGRATTGVQEGGAEDAFELFIGGDGYSANSAPIWVCRKVDGLKAPTMSAVEQFKKAVEETEKAIAEKQKQQQKQKNP
jgi:hypothetical protein